MVAPNTESVEYQLHLKAEQAFRELQRLTSEATTFNQKIALVSASLKKFAGETGLHIKAVSSAFKEMDKNFTEASGKSAFFGEAQKLGWDEVERGAGKAVRSIDAVRIALGVLVSMLIFNVIQAFQNAFRAGLNNLQEFEATLFRISNVERELSLKGVEVSVENLKNGIKELKEFLPIFSEEDIAQMVGSLATATSHLGLSEKQILDLAKAIAILNVQSVEEETLLQTQSKVVNAIVTSQSKGVGNLGLTFSKTRMEAEATRLGLLELGETLSDLTDQEKTQVKLAIVLDKAGVGNVASDFQNLNNYLETTDAKTQELKATWNDFLKNVAIEFAPLIIEFLQSSIDLIKNWNDALERSKPLIDKIVFSLAGIQRIQHDINELNAGEGGFKKLLSGLMPALAKLDDLSKVGIFKSFKEGFDEAAERADNFGKFVETPTGALEDLSDALDETALDAEEFSNKIEDIIQDAANARDDLQTNFDRKLADIDEEYRRKALDAQTDYTRKVEDINRSADQKRQDAINKSREEDLKAERDYQNKLWELRMRYLMDLEEALHARDARQVLRLMKQYAFDKEALLRRRNQEDQARAEGLQADLERIEIERGRRLADAQLEYNQKLADQRIAKQRELDDLEVWRERELADIEEGIRRKMETLIQGWIQEGKITQAGAQQVYDILRSYFGPGGLTDQLYAYMMNSLASASQLPSSMAGAPAPYFNLAAAQSNNLNSSNMGTNIGGGIRPTGGRIGRGFAEGGTLLATRPMTATFGEVPEVVSFTPLNGGNNVGKMFGDKSALGGGMLELLLTLSPDLESRIVRRSMDETANVIIKVNRSKS